MRWASPYTSKSTPSSYSGRKNFSERIDCATILRDSLLARFESSDNVPPCSFPVVARIQWTEEFSEIEAYQCTIGCGNMCHGAD